jgi:hypothetical protein
MSESCSPYTPFSEFLTKRAQHIEKLLLGLEREKELLNDILEYIEIRKEGEIWIKYLKEING